MILRVCNQGRHRSVANKECLHELFHERWDNKQPGNIHMIDLQKQKQWKDLCDMNCLECSMQDPRNMQVVQRGKDLLLSNKRDKKGRTRNKGLRASTMTSEHIISEATSHGAAAT